LITIEQAVTDEQIRHVQELLVEYFEFLRTDVDNDLADLNDAYALAGYKDEIASLPGSYAPPEGRLLLAQVQGEAAGCVALYKMSDRVCELKRLWTRPQFRGKKIGRLLVETLIAEARKGGYTSMILNTVGILKEATSLYRSLGFELTAPYYKNPEDVLDYEIFMRLNL
jgi:putative acetyltransferase